MTTAPTPSEKVQRLAITLEIVGAVPDMHYVTVPRHVARDASVELRRLERENDRLLAQIHKLEMDALDLASENSILKRQEQEELEARKPLPLSDEQIDAIADGMPGGLGGFMKTWGWRQFARKILDLRAPPIWEPEFDAMESAQEALAVQFCIEIAGLRGQKGSPPDPVRLLEMAQALYKAEADAIRAMKDKP